MNRRSRGETRERKHCVHCIWPFIQHFCTIRYFQDTISFANCCCFSKPHGPQRNTWQQADDDHMNDLESTGKVLIHRKVDRSQYRNTNHLRKPINHQKAPRTGKQIHVAGKISSATFVSPCPSAE